MATDDQQTPDQDQLQQEIEATRERLGHTVEQLSDKLDVKKQAGRHKNTLLGAGAAVVAVTVIVVLWRRRG